MMNSSSLGKLAEAFKWEFDILEGLVSCLHLLNSWKYWESLIEVCFFTVFKVAREESNFCFFKKCSSLAPRMALLVGKNVRNFDRSLAVRRVATRRAFLTPFSGAGQQRHRRRPLATIGRPTIHPPSIDGFPALRTPSCQNSLYTFMRCLRSKQPDRR